MFEIYNFLAGTGVWIAFSVLVLGMALRLAFLFGLSKERDKVFYNHLSFRWGIRSIVQWLIPFGNRTFREKPVFASGVWAFHFCLFAAPLFLTAHNMLLRESLGISLPSMPDVVADALTVLLVIIALGFVVRRIALPEVRLLSSWVDYGLLLLTIAPFVTGFLAYHAIGPYRLMIILHMFFSELLLVLIPFTKLSHAVVFFLTRIFIASDMGRRREMAQRQGAKTW